MAKSNYLRRINEKNDFALPGVPGRFLFFLLGGGVLGLGFVLVFCSLLGSPGREVDSEKGSPGIICILEKGGAVKLYWKGLLSSKVEENSYLSKVSDSTTSKKTRDVRIAKAKKYNISFFLEGTHIL